ncbi:MAG: hypothetical protein ACKVX7_15610 [Planctomycetota bacterium]
MATNAPALNLQSEHLIRRKVFNFLGPVFHIYDSSGIVVLYCRQKVFKLKEDIRIYSDDTMREERLLIKARQIVDFSAAYDVVDSRSSKKLGALRRKGFRSLLRDSWEFLDAHDRPIAKLEEDSMTKATLRRFLSNLIPQTFHAKAGDKVLVTYRQFFNPFVFKMVVRAAPDAEQVIDPNFALAAGILLAAIEGRQR